MNRTGDETAQGPVFLINEAGRDARICARLPVHELPLPAPSAITSIEELAAGYVTVVRRTQPFGPYRLLGNALGGLVAYELANQLLGRDERVEFLGMTGCPRPRSLPPGKSVGRATIAVTERYCPQPLPIPLYYFVSERDSDVETTFWRALAGDSLRVIASADALTHDVLADAIAGAPKRQHAGDREPYSPLVTVHIGPVHNAPVIFVPGAGGSVTSGLRLAESLREWTTVHGLQPRGFNRSAVPHRTVEAAATVYLRAIRQAQPHGPYRLAGHSFGGWVVFELACRLAAEGENVHPIALIDSEAPTPANTAPSHHGRVDALMKLIHALEEFSERRTSLACGELVALDCESQLARLAHAMKELGVLPRSGDADAIRGLVRVFEANLNTRYIPASRFPGRAVLFQPADRSRPVDREEECDPGAMSDAWRDHVGHLACVPVPGKHMTMLKKPHVEVIAGHLSRLWNELGGNRGAQARSS